MVGGVIWRIVSAYAGWRKESLVICFDVGIQIRGELFKNATSISDDCYQCGKVIYQKETAPFRGSLFYLPYDQWLDSNVVFNSRPQL